MNSKNLLSKFRGCMAGGLIGDSLGSPYEGDSVVGLFHLKKYFEQLRDPKIKVPFKPYTDDTAMTKCVANSLVECKGYDSDNLAKKFAEEYFQNPKRGYGGAVGNIFKVWKKSNFEDIFEPAKDQFGGFGSFGNGAAMRVSPFALMYFHDQENMINTATMGSKITHAHELGCRGAILQCLAVAEALRSNDNLDYKSFLRFLIKKMEEYELNDPPEEEEPEKKKKSVLDPTEPVTLKYSLRLGKAHSFLDKKTFPSSEDIVEELGVQVAALDSVPTAIYCFLAAQRPIPKLEDQDVFVRSLAYAISLGGDTDTIASMTGALVGAHLGIEGIPEPLLKQCEGYEDILILADNIYDVHTGIKHQGDH